MFRVLFIFFFFIFYSLQAFSTIILEGVGGASRDNLHEDRKSPIIWGGTIGANPGTCNDVCDTCTGGGNAPEPCNKRRINENGYLTLNFRSDTRSGIPIVTDSSKQVTIHEREINALILSANENKEVRVLWSRICEGRCDLVGNNGNDRITIVIGIDGSNNGEGNGSLNDSEDDSLQVIIEIKNRLPSNGIETFALFPGDEKVFMLLNPRPDGGGDEELIPGRPNIVFPSGFPFYEGSLIKEIRFYYEEVLDDEDERAALGRIRNNSTYVRKEVIRLGDSGDVDLGSTLYFTKSDGPDEKKDRQFENGVKYVFKIALVDEAGNVGLFRDNHVPTEIETRQVVVPSDVMGALEQQNTPSFCFIATAAYGRSHKMLDVFYKFRDQKLLPYKLGRIIHNLYYTYSPYFADIIRDNVFLKYIARILLIPFWIYAFLALQIGHILTFFLLSSFISMFMYLFIKKRFFRILWLSK